MNGIVPKKNRIKISNLNDFKCELKREGYEINKSNEEDFKKELGEIFKVDNILIENIYT